MKILVFAHKPPPVHGQSYAVEMLVNALGGDVRQRGGESHRPHLANGAFECYHVDSRLSASIADIGRAGLLKLVSLLRYCIEAIWCRLRYGVSVFYYVPAPAQPAAIYRDWIVMALCRPFFKHRIYHWHAAGLGNWVNQTRSWRTRLTRWLLGSPDLSIVLADFNRRDPIALSSRQIVVVPSGIPDPCPDFDLLLKKQRQARIEERARILADAVPSSKSGKSGTDLHRFDILYIGLCTRSKGIFDALDAVAIANQALRARGITIHLNVAGAFWHENEKIEFENRVSQPDLSLPQPAVSYRGFVPNDEKVRLFRESDALCFPTFYETESFGLVLVEAMAYGLPVIATRWRMVPEVLPPDYPALVDPHSPKQIANAIEAALTSHQGLRLRDSYLKRFTSTHFVESMKRALSLLATVQS